MATFKPLVIGLGELLWDDFPDGRRPGGAPANVAYHAQLLGCQSLVASRVGDDDAGRELLDVLRSKGVDVSLVQLDSVLPTGRVSVQFSPSGEPDYVIHGPVAWDALEYPRELQLACRFALAICFGTLAQRDARSRETIAQCLDATHPDCLRVYDINLRQSYFEREWIEASLARASILKLNASELQTLCSLLGVAGDFRVACNEILERWSLEAVVVTRGREGCWAVTAESEWEVPGIDVEEVDPVGAGDAFTAGLIWASLQGLWWGTRLAVANRLGALVASQPGAMPDIAGEARGIIFGH